MTSSGPLTDETQQHISAEQLNFLRQPGDAIGHAKFPRHVLMSEDGTIIFSQKHISFC